MLHTIHSRQTEVLKKNQNLNMKIDGFAEFLLLLQLRAADCEEDLRWSRVVAQLN